MQIDDVRIAVVGLGYVGLPLAAEFGKKRSVIGFDINHARIQELKGGHDHTLEVDAAELASASQLTFTTELSQLAAANFYIVTVPTPIDRYKNPDLTPLIKASETIGKVLKAGDIVAVREKAKKQVRIVEALSLAEQIGMPSWVSVDAKKMEGTFKAAPDRSDIAADVNESLIVELYSR